MPRISRHQNIVHSDIEIFTGADSHLDADRGVYSQMTVQFVGQHARTPFAHSVAGDRRVDDRNDIRRIQRMPYRKAVEHPALAVGFSPEDRRQPGLHLLRRDFVRQFARLNRSAQLPGREQLRGEQPERDQIVPGFQMTFADQFRQRGSAVRRGDFPGVDVRHGRHRVDQGGRNDDRAGRIRRYDRYGHAARQHITGGGAVRFEIGSGERPGPAVVPDDPVDPRAGSGIFPQNVA